MMMNQQGICGMLLKNIFVLSLKVDGESRVGWLVDWLVSSDAGLATNSRQTIA